MHGRHDSGGYLGLLVFALTFALVEAAVVVYLRQIFAIDSKGLFPLRLEASPDLASLMRVEQFREGATLLILLIPAILYGKGLLGRFAAYCLVFGAWDLGYYAWLRALSGWPESLLTYDLLFLLPVVWVSPVLCPVLVSLGLTGFSSGFFWVTRNRPARAPAPLQMMAVVGGGALVLGSFVQHAEYYAAGGLPPQFGWALFLAGYGLAAAGATWFLVDLSRQPKTRFG